MKKAIRKIFAMLLASFMLAGTLSALAAQNPGDKHLYIIGPIYPEGFGFEYEAFDTLDLTGLGAMGTYVDDDFNFSEEELTGLTFSPPHGTVLRCDPEDEVSMYHVYIIYEEDDPVLGHREHIFDFVIAVHPCSHSGEAREETTPATCADPGERRSVCAKCEAVLRTEPIDALPHAPGSRTVTLEPTYTEKGAWEILCTACGTLLESGEIDVLPAKAVTVGEQMGTLTAGSEGSVTFHVETANIASGVYAATVANTPAGVSAQEQIAINDNAGTLTLSGSASTASGTTATLTLTVDGATSAAFTLTIDPATTQQTAQGTQNPAPTPTPTPTPEPTVITDTDPPLSDAPNPFADVAAGAWYYDSVMYVYGKGLMTGTSVTPMLFSPNGHTTRGMIAAILYRLEGSPGASGVENPFSDVADGKWYTDAVIWAHHNEIVSGYDDGRFGPEDSMTREQLAAMLLNYELAFDRVPRDILMDREFSDWDDISVWAKNAVNRLTIQGIINGKPGNLFDPKGNATRAEVAAMFMRFLESVEKEQRG